MKGSERCKCLKEAGSCNYEARLIGKSPKAFPKHEDEEDSDRLETGRCAPEQELGNSASSNLASQEKSCAKRRRTARRGQAVPTASRLPKLKNPHASLGKQQASL